ncbi:MAG: GNAT family N-acetyltransferase [Flavobacteriaceae bacterium]|jgi:ribosomal protein S18 acetylase RimI-like enzyme|nr:GNAT family N-acetyltransferase [Flavobacteriaceae bacterium]
MKLEKLNLLNQGDVAFMENLYTESFLKEGRRPVDRMFKTYEENKDIFSILLAVQDDNRIGFFTYWDLGEFIFAEHFAIYSDFRDSGYGSKVINLFMESTTKPIVLEVEPPDSRIAERRIVFYERLGFKLWDDIEYRQPSYYQDGKSYPMILMTVGDIDLGENGKDIIHKIHTIAYNI